MNPDLINYYLGNTKLAINLPQNLERNTLYSLREIKYGTGWGPLEEQNIYMQMNLLCRLTGSEVRNWMSELHNWAGKVDHSCLHARKLNDPVLFTQHKIWNPENKGDQKWSPSLRSMVCKFPIQSLVHLLWKAENREMISTRDDEYWNCSKTETLAPSFLFYPIQATSLLVDGIHI